MSFYYKKIAKIPYSKTYKKIVVAGLKTKLLIELSLHVTICTFNCISVVSIIYK